jgi:hypothetical protein
MNFEEFLNETRSSFKTDPSNPLLLAPATGQFGKYDRKAGTKVVLGRYENGKRVSKTKYTLQKGQTAEDLHKQVSDANPGDHHYKIES